MKKLNSLSLIILLSLHISVASCMKPGETYSGKLLVKGELIGEFSPAEIAGRYTYAQAALFANHSVQVYRIVYKTINTDGSMIEASGALMVPVTNAPLPLISHHHGTITSDHSAPSNYRQSSEAWRIGTLLASAGTVVSAPDYIGYGASKHLPHPYEHGKSLATASRDMLRAVREFCSENNIILNDKLFLTGYSEGGYATMALHKMLEEEHADEFVVTASAPGAGAYHKSAFAQAVVQSARSLNYINNYLWVLQTYNSVYGLNRPFTYYLNNPYADRVTKNGVFAEVARQPEKLFTEEFRSAVFNKSDAAFIAALQDNDVYDWKPRAPVALFHGTDDDFVPFFNSQNAFDAMTAQGAKDVELRAIKGANHGSAIREYSMGVLIFFSKFLD